MIDWVAQEGGVPEDFVNVDLRRMFGMDGTRDSCSDIGRVSDLR